MKAPTHTTKADRNNINQEKPSKSAPLTAPPFTPQLNMTIPHTHIYLTAPSEHKRIRWAVLKEQIPGKLKEREVNMAYAVLVLDYREISNYQMNTWRFKSLVSNSLSGSVHPICYRIRDQHTHTHIHFCVHLHTYVWALHLVRSQSLYSCKASDTNTCTHAHISSNNVASCLPVFNQFIEIN